MTRTLKKLRENMLSGRNEKSMGTNFKLSVAGDFNRVVTKFQTAPLYMLVQFPVW
jgi:hypothetical protein